jgi:hypothetical protein
MNFEDYLNDLATRSYDDTLGNYDQTLGSDDAYDAVEVENYIASKYRKPRGVARQMADRIVRSPSAKAQVKQQMRQDGYKAGFEPSGMGGNVGQALAAQFDIKIKRLTQLFPEDVPVPIFGAFDIASKYNSILQLPAGISISAISIGAVGTEKQVRISYTKGVNTDIVQLTIAQYDYPAFLSALIGSRFIISNARYSISDTSATGLQQLTKPFSSIDRSMFGALLKNDIPLSSAKTPYQNQVGIVDINGTFNVTAQTTWVLDFQSLANQEVTISAFVTKSDKGVI